MTIEERIEQVSDREIAESLVSGDDKLYAISRIIRAYGFDCKSTTTEEGIKILNDFLGRFARLIAMYRVSEIAEMQQREKLAKIQLRSRITSDILIWFAYAQRTSEITTDSVYSLAEKIIERVQNA